MNYETNQVMKLLGASRATVKRLAHDGKLIIAQHGGGGLGAQTTYTAESVQAQANLQLARQFLESASPEKVSAVLKVLNVRRRNQPQSMEGGGRCNCALTDDDGNLITI